MSEFPSIADYAFLSDCETNALVAPDGGIEWLCVPRPDAPSIFGRLLDRGAGFARLAPVGVQVPAQRRYVPGTMVLETTWATDSGWLVVYDALVMGPWTGRARDATARRPPADVTARGALVRTARCLSGTVELQLDCFPVFDYGRSVGEWAYEGDDYGVARCTPHDGTVSLLVSSDLRLGLVGARAGSRSTLEEGQTATVALSWGAEPLDPAAAEAAIEETTRYWRGWLRHGTFPDHPWRPYLERSALTLKGLSYAPTGALLAAATTSLPETPGGERNWDYRFSWIRDSAFNLWALFELGFEWEAIQYFAFIGDALSGGELQIMYGIDAERDLTERTLDHLSGYEGARPVRVGNGAFDQQQHDVWGMVLDAVHTHVHQASELGPLAWQLIQRSVEKAGSVWRTPDRGIWEVRGEPRHFTSSKVMCWVAVDRGAKLADSRGDTELATRWRALADEIHEDVCAHGVDGRGAFTQCYDAPALDASALLVPLMGFLPPDDERVRATVLAIADELTEDGLALRYRVEETDDGLSGKEGTFTICSFWLASGLAMIGESERANALVEKLLSFASPLHLYAEEIDAASGKHWGNFPQAFTHLALIDAVLRVIELNRPG